MVRGIFHMDNLKYPLFPFFPCPRSGLTDTVDKIFNIWKIEQKND